MNITVSVKDSPEKLRETFREQGVLVFPDFLGAERLATLNEAIAGHYNPIVQERFGVDAISESGVTFECEVLSWDPRSEGSPPFRDLAEDQEFARLTEAVLGEGYTAPASLVMWSVGGGKGQAWHQDCPADDPQAYNVNRLFYMQDTREEDGAIVVVPGSHTRGRISRGGPQESLEGEVVLTPSAGTLVLLHGHVFHRVTPNVSRRPRVSVNYRAYPAGVSPSVNSIGVYRNGAYDFANKKQVDR